MTKSPQLGQVEGNYFGGKCYCILRQEENWVACSCCSCDWCISAVTFYSHSKPIGTCFILFSWLPSDHLFSFLNSKILFLCFTTRCLSDLTETANIIFASITIMIEIKTTADQNVRGQIFANPAVPSQ